jgi:Domain of unknown function (DUF5666)
LFSSKGNTMIRLFKRSSHLSAKPKGSLMSRWSTSLLFATALVVTFSLGAKVLTGGTGRADYGVIEEFGSIVVHGIHYDETAANIVIDGVPNQTRASLKLGMVANIEGAIDYALNTGTASTVRVSRTLIGQVEDVNISTGEVRILSQRVSTDVATRLDGYQSLDQLAAGSWVAIHGLSDPKRRTIVATLVERIDATSLPASVIRGTVKSRGTGSFQVGNLNVISSLSNQPEDGTFVAVRGSYTINSGNLFATDVQMTREVETHEGVETELTGYVADFRSISSFTVAGVPVDASGASFGGGRPGDIKQDVRITVEGRIVNGILQADEVEIRSARVVAGPGTGTGTLSADPVIELEGVITEFTSMANFVVKGKRIDASEALTTSKPGLQIRKGLKAHAKGRVLLDGSVMATQVEFVSP